MAMNQKAMAESELRLRQFARNRARKLRFRKLLNVDGYSTSIRKHDNTIVFSSNKDSWCFSFSVDSVKKLLADGELERTLRRKHEHITSSSRLSMNQNGFFNGIAQLDIYKAKHSK